MRVLILRSERHSRREGAEGAYIQEFSSPYADRVIGNIVGEDDFCVSCGPDCIACRKIYDRKFSENIAGVISFPNTLPYLIERPDHFVPGKVPSHDILLAINIHEQILIEVIRKCRAWGTRGVVAPIEDPDWISGATRARAEEICRECQVEIDFPKPFCTFDPPAHGVLDQFRNRFHIGKPKVDIHVQDGRIASADVRVSAPCGATYYIARWLEGKSVDDDLEFDVVSKRLHSYPCTGSMKWDKELNDTVLHMAGQAHREILTGLIHEPQEEPNRVMSPLGIMVLKPVPPRENLENIEKAKKAILSDLASGEKMSLQSLRSKPNITPAAIHSAMLLLKQEGKITTEGYRIFPA
jgi:hypothetical protein